MGCLHRSHWDYSSTIVPWFKGDPPDQTKYFAIWSINKLKRSRTEQIAWLAITATWVRDFSVQCIYYTSVELNSFFFICACQDQATREATAECWRRWCASSWIQRFEFVLLDRSADKWIRFNWWLIFCVIVRLGHLLLPFQIRRCFDFF